MLHALDLTAEVTLARLSSVCDFIHDMHLLLLTVGAAARFMSAQVM